MNPHRLRAYLYLLAVACIWGAASAVIKYTLRGIDPIPFLAYRFAIAGIFSLAFFGRKIAHGKKFHQLRAHLPLALLYGFLAIPLSLGILFFGLDKSSVLDLTLITAIEPMIIIAGGALFYHDHITKKEKFGIVIVLIGVFINSFVPLFGLGSGARLTGNILLILYLLSDASSALVAKRALRHKIKSANLANLAFILGAVILIPLALVTYGTANLTTTIISLPLKYHLGVWFMALISGNLAYSLYVRGYRTVEVSEASLFAYLMPVLGIPLAIFWLHESLSISFLIGAILIIIGLVIAEYKKRSSLKA